MRMGHLEWMFAGIAFLIVILLLLPFSLAADTLEDAAVSGGVDGLVAGIVSAISIGVGWCFKLLWDVYLARQGGEKPAQTAAEGFGQGAIWKLIVDDLATHEKECGERWREQRASNTKIHERINDMGDKLTRMEAMLARIDERTKKD